MPIYRSRKFFGFESEISTMASTHRNNNNDADIMYTYLWIRSSATVENKREEKKSQRNSMQESI